MFYDLRDQFGRLVSRLGPGRTRNAPVQGVFPFITLHVRWATPARAGDSPIEPKEESATVAVDQASIGLYVRIGEAIGHAITDHEEHFHIPPARRGPLQAVPFADVVMNDAQVVRARELLENGATIFEAADIVGVPVSVVERELADFEPRWHRFLLARRTAI